MKKKELKLALAQCQAEIRRLDLKVKLLESGKSTDIALNKELLARVASMESDNRNMMGKNRELLAELTSYKEFHDQAVALFSHMTKSSDEKSMRDKLLGCKRNRALLEEQNKHLQNQLARCKRNRALLEEQNKHLQNQLAKK